MKPLLAALLLLVCSSCADRVADRYARACDAGSQSACIAYQQRLAAWNDAYMSMAAGMNARSNSIMMRNAYLSRPGY